MTHVIRPPCWLDPPLMAARPDLRSSHSWDTYGCSTVVEDMVPPLCSNSTLIVLPSCPRYVSITLPLDHRYRLVTIANGFAATWITRSLATEAFVGLAWAQ